MASKRLTLIQANCQFTWRFHRGTTSLYVGNVPPKNLLVVNLKNSSVKINYLIKLQAQTKNSIYTASSTPGP